MESAVSAIRIPKSYQEIISIADRLWESLCEDLEFRLPNELQKWIDESFSYLSELSKSRDNSSMIRLLIGLTSLYHFYLSNLSTLNPLFDTLLNCQLPTTMLAVATCISRIATQTCETDDKFARRYLNRAIGLLKARTDFSSNMMGLFLIREISDPLPYFFIFNYPDAQDLLWPFVLSENDSIRTISTDVFRHYLLILIRARGYNLRVGFERIFNSSIIHIKSTKGLSSLGAIGILSALIDLKPVFFESLAHEIFAIILPFLQSRNTSLRISALECISRISLLDKEMFIARVFTSFLEEIKRLTSNRSALPTICSSLLVLIKSIQPLTRYNHDIQHILIGLSNTANNEDRRLIVQVLSEITRVDPEILSEFGPNLWVIVKRIMYDHSFIDFFQILINQVPSFLKSYRKKLCEELIYSLKNDLDVSQYALKLIPMIPDISIDHRNELLHLSNQFLFSKNDDQRAASPLSILHLTPSSGSEKLLKKIIGIALSEPSPKVRASFLESFGDDFYPLLSQEPFIPFFVTLSKDVSPNVRILCYRLLKQLRPFSPLSIDIILRRAVINHFWKLRFSSSVLEKTQSSESFPDLLNAASSIVHIFVPTIIPFCNELLSTRGQHIISIQTGHENQLTYNLLQIIQTVLKINRQYIVPYLNQILPIFTTILGEFSEKRIKMSILKTLYLYVKQSQAPAEIYSIAPQLLEKLMVIISSSNSTSLRVMALLFIAQCGAISPQRVFGSKKALSHVEHDFYDLFKITDFNSLNSYFGQVVLNKLMSFINDMSLGGLHEKTLTTIINILASIPFLSSEYIEPIVNVLFKTLTEGLVSQKLSALSHLERLIFFAKQRICPFIPSIMRMMNNLWSDPFLESNVNVIFALFMEVRTDFSDFIGPIIPKLFETLSSSYITHPTVSKACLRLLAVLAPSYSQVSPMIFRIACRIASDDFALSDVRRAALAALHFLVQKANPSTFQSLVFSTIIDLVDDDCPYMSTLSKQIMYSLFVRIGEIATFYSKIILEKFCDDRKTLEEVNAIFILINSGQKLSFDLFPFILQNTFIKPIETPKTEDLFDPNELIQSLSNIDMQTAKHWNNWYRKILLNFIRSSPSSIVSACYDLASVHMPLADYLFFPALLSCWMKMCSQFRTLLTNRFLSIMHHKLIPQPLLQRFVTLCELMEKAEKPMIPVSDEYINLSIQAQIRSLALYYTQEIYFANPTKEILWKLITISIETGNSSLVKPLLGNLPIEHSKPLLLQLGQWESALKVYGNAISPEEFSFDDLCGYIKSSSQLRRYDLIIEKTQQFNKLSRSQQQKLAIDFAEAHFFGKNYQMMHHFSSLTDSDSIKGQMYLSLSLILTKQYKTAQSVINGTFRLIAQQKAQQFKSLYSSVYPTIVICQSLHEFLELVETEGQVPVELWQQRLKNCEPSAEVWWPLLKTRIAFTPNDNMLFLRSLDLFLQEQQFSMFEMMFKYLFPSFTPSSSDPVTVLLYLRYLWAKGERENALSNLKNILNSQKKTNQSIPVLLLYSDWTLAQNGRSIPALLEVAELLKDPSSSPKCAYSVTQKWASVNFLLYRLYSNVPEYAINAVTGFAQCIKDQPVCNFADLAQILTIFFGTANDPYIYSQTSALFSSIPPIKFVDAIPQLMAQLGHQNEMAASIAEQIIRSLTKNYIQSIVFHLYLASESSNELLSNNSKGIIQQAMNAHPNVMREARKLRILFISAAITLFEKWIMYSSDLLNELLEEVSNPSCPMDRLFKRINFDMLEKISDGIQNSKDITMFVEQIRWNCESFINGLEKIRLSDVTDKNFTLTADSILIPGGPNGVTIASVLGILDVLSSKQHPRRLTTVGTDGKKYNFLLKGNEDLPLDQRVIQFYSLVNSIVRKDFFLASETVSIRTYCIVPLSHDIGLIQWIDGSDTFHRLIAEYRSYHGIDELQEVQKMQSLTIPDFNLLKHIQRLEALEEVNRCTSYDDLRRVFWLKSPSSDAWLERSMHFQKSMAISSVVGYIIGLGDRHTSNIMVDRQTGDVIHIDFGDCFEVATHRIVFPEKIPFRLTRMITRAFGVCGIDSDFKTVFARVLAIIRENCNPLVSVLEMFVQEPTDYDFDEEDIARQTTIIKRLWDKMLGNDFDTEKTLVVEEQVDSLINAAKDMYNLSHLYSGWCPLW